MNASVTNKIMLKIISSYCNKYKGTRNSKNWLNVFPSRNGDRDVYQLPLKIQRDISLNVSIEFGANVRVSWSQTDPTKNLV